MMAIIVWIGLNIVLAYVFGLTAGMGIAWEAHIGGFLTGLVLFGVFDRGGGPIEDQLEPE